jgi:transposase
MAADVTDPLWEADDIVAQAYVEHLLVRELRPGDIVIMDNLSSHKGPAIRQAIRSAGAKQFFLPKYSPDLNPIEQVFAKLKHLLRKKAARTIEAVCAAIGQLLDAFTPQECANYFKNAGYDPTKIHPALIPPSASQLEGSVLSRSAARGRDGPEALSE